MHCIYLFQKIPDEICKLFRKSINNVIYLRCFWNFNLTISGEIRWAFVLLDKLFFRRPERILTHEMTHFQVALIYWRCWLIFIEPNSCIPLGLLDRFESQLITWTTYTTPWSVEMRGRRVIFEDFIIVLYEFRPLHGFD